MPREIGPPVFRAPSGLGENAFYINGLSFADFDDDPPAGGAEQDRFGGYFAVRIETIAAAI